MTIYTDSAASVDAGLRSVGQVVTLVSETTGAYDPALGAAPIVTSQQDAVAVVFDLPLREVDGSLIQLGDKRVYMSPYADGSAEPLDPAPNPAMRVLIGDRAFSVINADPLAPAGEVVLWTLQVRG